MFIIKLEHPRTGDPYLMEWDVLGRGPADGTPLLPPVEFVEWVKEKRAEHAGQLKQMLAHVKHHGTSHKNAYVTPERWLARSYYKTADGGFGPYSVEQLFELHGQAGAPAEPKPEKEATAPPPPAPLEPRKRKAPAKRKPRKAKE